MGLADQLTPPQTIEVVLTLKAPVFDQDKKWQFFLGQQSIFARITDESFCEAVFRGVHRFGVNDKLRVELQIAQTMLENGRVRNDYEIINVIGVITGPRQLTVGEALDSLSGEAGGTQKPMRKFRDKQ